MFLVERLTAEAFLQVPVREIEGSESFCDVVSGEIFISPEQVHSIASRWKLSPEAVFWVSVLHEAGHIYDPLRLEYPATAAGTLACEEQAWANAESLLTLLTEQEICSVDKKHFLLVKQAALHSYKQALKREEKLLSKLEELKK